MTSEQHQFTAQGRTFPVILVRKKVKNINLHVRSDGTLYLSAPARVPWAYIEDFLEKKTDFIIREMEERKQKFPILTLSDGDTLYLAGQPYRLDVRLGLHNSIRRSGQTVFMELAWPMTRRSCGRSSTISCCKPWGRNSFLLVCPVCSPYSPASPCPTRS